ncbi:PP2C family protein-serine/threonine phosphatase [uncultured Streptomyces sp.]|uniref:PP2C family protein-serine/threonine phosphatase n=1 Tax=uncultured Streptomyces sp. TaxID=174707 RepID=UPI0026277621|nr:PP2C family protein-serine/threonine phosphatase [uncultured Streptomyces sp.]
MTASAAGEGERLLQGLLADMHASTPGGLPALVNAYGERLGMRRVQIRLVDLQQKQLTLLASESRMPVDGSPAGSTYRSRALRLETGEDGCLVVWLPLVDGAERLGVVGIEVESLDSTLLARCGALAAVLSMAITSKRAVSDRFVQQARTDTMTLPSEMLRAVLPPRTIGEARAISTAVLEPAYELGGDAFDHSLGDSVLHAVILDAMGHNLSSGLTTAIAMAGCRSARRAGSGLRELVGTVDEALAEWLPEQFCTGIVMRLDLPGGVLSWVNCGHPPPLLIRDDQVLKDALAFPGEPPMGTPGALTALSRTVHQARLQPGDRVILYTDGVTEARSPGGPQFGLAGFTTSIIRATAAGELAAEALRQLMHSLLQRQDGRLDDDATILMIEWRGPH